MEAKSVLIALERLRKKMTGEFDVLAAIYLMASGVAVFLRRNEVSKSIRNEKVTRYVAKIVREKTDAFLRLVLLMYGAVASGSFVIFGHTWNYSGWWWIPLIVNVPALLSGLVQTMYLQVIRHDSLDETRDVFATKYEGSERVFFISGFFTLLWPWSSGLLLSAVNQAVDVVSWVVIVAVPEVVYLVTLIAGNKASRW